MPTSQMKNKNSNTATAPEKRGRGRPKDPNSLPYKIQCIITGQNKAVRPDVLEKRIEKAGSLERLQETYMSSEAKRMLREGMTVDQIRKQIKASNPKDPVPNTPVDQTIIDEYLAGHGDNADESSTSTPRSNVRSRANVNEVTDRFVEEASQKLLKSVAPALRSAARGLARELVA